MAPWLRPGLFPSAPTPLLVCSKHPLFEGRLEQVWGLLGYVGTSRGGGESAPKTLASESTEQTRSVLSALALSIIKSW